MQRLGRPSGWGETARALVFAGLSALALSGCSSIADAPLIGMPTNAPQRPATTGAYLPVHDLPPPRQEETLSSAEQTRIEKELSDLRARGKNTAAADAGSASKSSKRAARKGPAQPAAK